MPALTVTIPEALARRVEAVARAQGRGPDDVIVEALELTAPVDPDVEAAVKARFGFAAIGDGPDDLAERHTVTGTLAVTVPVIVETAWPI